MPAPELEEAVKIYLHQGAKPEDIKEFLVSQGWQEQAVDEVLESHRKQPSIWKMLPTYKYYQELDRKTANLPPKKILAISAILIILVLLMIFANYIMMNLSSLSDADNRDKEREVVSKQLETALRSYYSRNGSYPAVLSALVPEFISKEPMDPKTGNPYGYFTKDNGANYSLCVIYESRPVSKGCLNPDVLSPDKLGIPEEEYRELQEAQ